MIQKPVQQDGKEQSEQSEINQNKKNHLLPDYYSIFNQASEPIYYTDLEGNIIDVNESFCRMFGYAKEDLMHLNVADLLEPQELKVRPIQYGPLLNGEHIFSERQVIKQNGEILEVEVNIKKCGENMLLGILKDLTEMKKVRKRMQLTEENYHTLFNQASYGIYVTDFDGNFVDANDSFCSLFGYSKQELEFLRIIDIIEPGQINEQQIALWLRAEGDPVFNYLKMANKSGGIRDIEINVNKFGENLVLGIARDITEMRKARKQIELSEANYHSIFNQASDAIYICNMDGYFLDANDSFCRMFDYSREELLSLKIEHIMEQVQLKQQPIQYSKVGTGQQLFGERRMVTKYGVIRDMEINLKMYEKDRVLAIARDVTEIRKTQNQVILSEARFRGAFEHSSIGMALVSLTGDWLKVNEALCQMTGYTEEEMLTRNFKEITYADDLESNLLFLKQTIDGKTEYFRMEKRYIHQNGSLIWVKINSSIIKGSNAEPLYFVSQIENITERKNSEQALKKSEANLQTIFDNTDTAYVLVNKELNIIAFNKYAWDFGKNEIGVSGKIGDNLSVFFLENRRQIIEKLIPDVFNGQNINYEASYPQKDGSVNWYNVRLYSISGTENEVFGLMLAIDNITKRKQDELERERIANDLLNRNKDLEKFTHIMSHNVRSHIARLMGLTNLLIDYKLSEPEKSDFISAISLSANELDEVVMNLNDVLQVKK